MINYLVMDVDGTLTDGKIYMGNNGELCKAFNIKDGCGIHDILLPTGIIPVIISGRKSDIVLNRCREIGIMEVYQGVSNKIDKLKEVVKDISRVAYIGDDINCLELLSNVGLPACPSDAMGLIKEIDSIWILNSKGGDGAVREFAETLLNRCEHPKMTF